MKFCIYILVGFLTLNIVFASGTLKIRDKATNEPMANVTVNIKILNQKGKDSILLRVSNKKGEVTLPSSSKIAIMLQYIGYKRLIDTINNSDKDLTLKMVQAGIKTEEIVVTGQLGPVSSQKSVYVVKTIGENRIFDQAATNLKDLLITESSMKISQDNIFGSGISINGISGSNIKILIDGVPVIGRINGMIDLNQINLYNASRVEIIEGSMSTEFGSDASGGVINIITREPKSGVLQYGVDSYYQSVGVYNFNVLFMYPIDKMSFSLNGGRNFFDGYDTTETSRHKQWFPKEQYFLDFQGIYNFENHKIRFTSQYFNEFILNRGARLPVYFETAFDDKYYTNRLTNSIFLNGKLGSSSFYEVTTSYANSQRDKKTYYKDMLTLNEKLTNDVTKENVENYLFRATYCDDNLTDILKYKIGTDNNYETDEGTKIKDGYQDIYDLAGFFSLQYLPNQNVTIQPSLRVIHNSKFEAPLIPAINLRYEIFKDLIFRASYAKGYRAPTLRELYLEFVDLNHNILGNENLKAEKSDGYSFSIQYSLNDEDYYFKVEPKFFFNHISEMITSVFVEGITYKNENISEYETTGGSLNLQYIRKNLNINTSYTYTGSLNSNYEAAGAPRYNFSSEFSINADYMIEEIGTKVSASYKYTGKEPSFSLDANDKVIQNILDDYSMLDFSFSKSFEYFIIAVGGKNLLDVKIVNLNSVSASEQSESWSKISLAWGTTFFIKLNIKV